MGGQVGGCTSSFEYGGAGGGGHLHMGDQVAESSSKWGPGGRVHLYISWVTGRGRYSR